MTDTKYDTLQSAYFSAYDSAPEYGLTKDEGQELLGRLANRLYISTGEVGELCIIPEPQDRCPFEETPYARNLYNDVFNGNTPEDCLTSVERRIDSLVELDITDEVNSVINEWLRRNGKDFDWEKQAAAFDYLNDMVAIELDHSFEQQKLKVNLVPSTEELITVGSREPVQVDGYVAKVIEAQGYSVEQVGAALDELQARFEQKPDDVSCQVVVDKLAETYGKFVASMAAEIDESRYGASCEFAVLATMTVKDYAKLGDAAAEITVPANAMCGLFNRHDGSGSLLGVKLEKPLTMVSLDLGEAQIENRGKNIGYFITVDKCYGLVGTCWEKAEAQVLTTAEKRERDIENALTEGARPYTREQPSHQQER